MTRLNYRNIYIFPSKSGLAFAFLTFLLLVIAAVYNNNLVYLLSFLLGSIFFVTILHTVQSLSGLELNLGDSPAIFLGETTQTPLSINNETTSTRFSVHINDQIIDISAQDKTVVTLNYKVNKRGYYQSPFPIIN